VFASLRSLSGFRHHPPRFARAALVIALLGCVAGLAGATGVLQPAPALAGSSAPFENCYPGQSGYSCTVYGPNGPYVTNCIEGTGGFSCTSSGPGGAASAANCLTSGDTYSCNVTAPGLTQTTNCSANGDWYTCTNSAGGAPASAYTCLTDNAGNQSCSVAPAATYVPVSTYQQPAGSTSGEYCTDAPGGQIWVPSGSSTSGLTCPSDSGS
jgi:hypothetical protein